MAQAAERLLELLTLLGTRPSWSAPELADRLGVTTRTVRADVERLRRLGYPVEGRRGGHGGYRLGTGGKLPPLLLDDEEAVAVAVGLRAGTGIAGLAESSTRALTKLEQVLPARLRGTVDALGSTIAAMLASAPNCVTIMMRMRPSSCISALGLMCSWPLRYIMM